MTDLWFYPRDALQQRAEIHAEATTGEVLAARVGQKVDRVVGPAPDIVPLPRLTRGTPLDELHAVEEAVDDHLRELSRLAGDMGKVEAEVTRLRALYARLTVIGAGVAAILVVIVVIVLVHR